MGLYKVEGIVIRRRNLGEADRLVTILTRDRGKFTVVAKGARRPKSRLGGRLEPPTRFRALVAEGRSLDVISQVEVLDAHAPLRNDLERMGAVSVVLELADRGLAERHSHPDVFRLLVETLSLMLRDMHEVAGLWFTARLLVLTGHRPAVGRCVSCGRTLRGRAVWSAMLGGCLDEACRSRDPQAMPAAPRTIALIAFLLDATPAALRRIQPPADETAAAGDVLRRYAEACWDARLRAPAVVGRVHRGLRVAESGQAYRT